MAKAIALELVGPESRLDPAAVSDTLRARAVERVGVAVRGGWTSYDLVQVVTRRLDETYVPLLAGVLVALAGDGRSGPVPPAWGDEIAALGPGRQLPTRSVEGVTSVLRLCSLIAALPAMPTAISFASSRAGSASGGADPLLAKVRALLAKAESTEFPHEAEALSAKAQQLISQHALHRLVAEAADATSEPEVRGRRIWIDAPYVLPKGSLVAAVAAANRCQTTLAVELGFATVLGVASDLEAVELLVTSLLVQASTVMLAHGSRQTRMGTTRTAAFRRSFLLAYASRIGERLTEASAAAASESGHGAELVPLLGAHEERVAAVRREMFPRLRETYTTASDAEGWAAGAVAADLARLDVRSAVDRAAS